MMLISYKYPYFSEIQEGQPLLLKKMWFLAYKCRKAPKKRRLRYDTRGLIVTRRYWLRNADNLGVILSELLSVSTFLVVTFVFKLKINVPVSCKNLRFCNKNASGVLLSRDYFHSQTTPDNFWVLPGVFRRLRLAMARKKRIFCRKMGVRSYGIE